MSRETAERRVAEILAAPSPLEQRVAALEATVDHLLNPVTPSSPTVFDLLRESVTVVKPGEVLFFTGPEYFTPTHVREVQDMIDWWLAENAPDVKAVVLPHGEFAAAEPAAAEAS